MLSHRMHLLPINRENVELSKIEQATPKTFFLKKIFFLQNLFFPWRVKKHGSAFGAVVMVELLPQLGLIHSTTYFTQEPGI